MEETESYNLEMEKIKSNPHNYIMDWMEGNLIHVGRRAFKLIALQPCSLILPDIISGINIRSTFNIFYVSSPSSGKTTLCNKYESITFSPFVVKNISSAQITERIENFIKKEGLFSLIIDDFSQLVENSGGYDKVKILEQVLGDDRRLVKENMRMRVDIKTRGIALLCGTWTDFSKYLEFFRSGLLFRSALLFINFTPTQRRDIINNINNHIGDESNHRESLMKEKIVKDYYEILSKIQSGENNEIPTIKGYFFSESIKDSIKKTFNQITEIVPDYLEHEFNREFHDAYRFLISSAFLNVFKRKVENGILYPNEEDLKLAKHLMVNNMNYKLGILTSKMVLSVKRSLEKLNDVLKSEMPTTTKKILYNLAAAQGYPLPPQIDYS